MKIPKVIVLILSYNGKHLLVDSISSYLQNEYKNYEVVVIDNGSSDGTKEFVEENYQNVKVLRTNNNLKYSGGFNFGLKYAFDENKADYVLITNNDVKADKRVISELVKIGIEYPNAGFITGKVYYFDNPGVLQTVGKKMDPIKWNGPHIGNREEDKGQYDEICERYFADDIFTLVSRSLYERVGGYDIAFAFQAEEYDWQARGKIAGFKIMYTPYAKIWHKESMTIGKSSALKLYYDARNPMLVILKYKSPEYFRRYLRVHMKEVFLSFLVNLKRGENEIAIAVIRGFVSGLKYGYKAKMLTLRHFI